jgi:hypothetical protein
MSSSTSGHTSSEPVIATDAERLPPEYRDAVYGRGLWLLWLAVVGGPLVWAFDLLTAYWLVYHVCHTGNMLPLYVETVVALALGLAVIVLAWRMLSRFPDAHRSGAQPGDRARFMAATGIGTSVLFFLIVLAAAVPRVVLTPCP